MAIVTYLILFTEEISVFSTSASTQGLSPAELKVVTVKEHGFTKLNKWTWAEINSFIYQVGPQLPIKVSCLTS